MRLLLIEDEEKVSRFIVKGLMAERFAVDVAAEGARGLELAQTYSYDLIILDLMLPGLSGTEALRLIRQQNERAPALAPSARDAVTDKVRHFELGADDYPTKPFAFAELLVRVKAFTLHEIYFANLGGGGKAAGDVLEAIKKAFGGYEQWEAEFERTGNALGGGSGWVILALNFHTGEPHNYWAWDHMHNAPFSRPLLAMDMYEHAYQMDYGAAAGKYVDAFMQNVNWEEVNRRFASAQKAAEALKA